MPGDHEEPAQLRERGNDVFADTVRKIFLISIAAHVGEGKHRNRTTFCRYSRCPLIRSHLPGDSSRRCAVVFLRFHIANEQQSLAWNRADESLVLAIVANGLSRRVDATGQR